MEHDLNINNFWHKRKMDNFDPYNLLLAIATNIRMTAYDWFCAPGSYMCSFA